jgi:TonB family protein
MSRLEKKCLLASAGAHGTLALLLFLWPLLLVTKHSSEIIPPLMLVPAHIIDGIMASGGNPKATAPPAPAPAPPRPAPATPAVPLPKPEVAPPPKPQRKVIQEEPEAPAKPATRRVRDALPDKKLARVEEADESQESTSTKPGRRKIQLSFERESGSTQKSPSASDSKADSKARAEAAAHAVQAYQSRLNGVLGAIAQGVSGGTAIEVPGPGGEVYADYTQYLQLAYKRAWTPPDDLADELATVKVRVVVARSGNVLSFHVVKYSGISALDRSVERLKQAVPFIAPFPEGAQDAQRAFLVSFNLKSYRE